MLKHLVHSNPNKLHTFDDFYRTTSKPIKTRPLNSDGTSSTSSSSSPTSPCSPSNNYTFYSIFSDFKSNSTSDPLPEEDETEIEQQQTDGKSQRQEQISIVDKPPSIPNTPLFYLDEDHNHNHSSSSSPSHQVTTTSTSTHSPSSNWPSLILNRFRHQPSQVVKQSSLNENQMSSTKLRKSELNDPAITRVSSNRFLKRSDTLDPTSTDHFNEDFPELSSPTTRMMSTAKKHRSFVSVFQHFPHPHLSSTINSKSNSCSSKSNSTGTLDSEPTDHPQRPKLVKQKAISSPQEIISSPVNKSPVTPILPKLASLFQRHHHHHHHSHSHLSEQYKHRVGNLKARLHHRRTSPSSSSSTTKFQCPSSNDLIHQITNDEEKTLPFDYLIDSETFGQQQRSTKPVIMKRVHTWHNSFNLTPIDQCLEY